MATKGTRNTKGRRGEEEEEGKRPHAKAQRRKERRRGINHGRDGTHGRGRLTTEGTEHREGGRLTTRDTRSTKKTK